MPEARGVQAEGRFRALMMPAWVASLAIAIALAVFVSTGITRHGLFDNEGRYAEVARDIQCPADGLWPKAPNMVMPARPFDQPAAMCRSTAAR